MTYDEAISQGSRDLRAKLIATDKTLTEEIKIINYTGALTSGKNFEIGTAIAARFSANLVDINGTLVGYSFKNKEFDLQFGINTGTSIVPVWEYHSVGKFTTDEAVQDGKKYTIQAIDRMYLLDHQYEGTLTYPATILQILQDACIQSGITLATTVFANSTYSIQQPSYVGVTCRKIAEAAAELAGGYATVNASGQLEIITLNMAQTPKIITDSTRISMSQDQTAVSTIDKVVVSVGDVEDSAGTGTNVYTIANNMFVQNPADVVDAIFAVLNGLTFSQVAIRWIGDYKVTLGQRIQITAGASTYYSFNLERNIQFNGGIREEITAPARSDIIKNSKITGPFKLQIDQINTEINVLDGEIGLLTSEVSELSNKANGVIANDAGIVLTPSAIISAVTESTEYTDDLSLLATKVELTQTAEEYKVAAEQQIRNEYGETIEHIETNFVFDISGLTIGKAGSAFSTKITNSEMGFYDGSTKTAYVSGGEFLINKGTVISSLTIGVHKIEKYSSGITIFRFVG